MLTTGAQLYSSAARFSSYFKQKKHCHTDKSGSSARVTTRVKIPSLNTAWSYSYLTAGWLNFTQSTPSILFPLNTVSSFCSKPNFTMTMKIIGSGLKLRLTVWTRPAASRINPYSKANHTTLTPTITITLNLAGSDLGSAK